MKFLLVNSAVFFNQLFAERRQGCLRASDIGYQSGTTGTASDADQAEQHFKQGEEAVEMKSQVVRKDRINGQFALQF
jgi:hypothetical protein